MIKDILLFGDIVPFIVNPNEVDLTTIYEKVAALNLKPEDTLRVGVHTFGGCTRTAFAMYNYFRRLVADGTVSKIITRVEGFCASSGVIILLAGDERVGNAFAEPFVHEAWTYLQSGNATELAKETEDLLKTDTQIATLYAKVTNITVDQALHYMRSDTWITAEECMKLGFYTKLEDVEGAETGRGVFNSLKTKRIKNNKNMSKPKSILNQIKDLMTKHKNKIVKDAAGKDVDFYELEESATPSVGDLATIDGSPAGDAYENGVVTMADGSVITFDGEEVISIVEPEEDEEIENTDDKDVEIARLKAELETANALNESNTTSINSLKKKYNKTKTEKDEAFGILTKINSIKDKQLQALLAGEEVETEENVDDEDEDEDLDDNGFPKVAPKRTVNNSQKPKPSTKSETGNLIAELNMNLFKGNRK